jgi:hypothetical protein
MVYDGAEEMAAKYREKMFAAQQAKEEAAHPEAALAEELEYAGATTEE